MGVRRTVTIPLWLSWMPRGARGDECMGMPQPHHGLRTWMPRGAPGDERMGMPQPHHGLRT
eukprot:365071-Chlamydomonas_euryale.AAC.4